MTDPWARPANEDAAPSAEPAPQAPDAPGAQPTEVLTASTPPSTDLPAYGADAAAPAYGADAAPTSYPAPQQVPATDPPKKRRGVLELLRDPMSLILIIVIALALSAAGVVGGEFYARSRGNDVVSSAVQCVVQDKVDVQFGATPFLWQVANSNYDHITVTTAGNQLRFAKGMKAQIQIDDVKLEKTDKSAGTIGSLAATVTWSSDGIKQTIADTVPVLGGLVSDVTTDPSSGTIVLDAPMTQIVAKPTLTDGTISLKVEQLTGLGFLLPRESIQPALDLFASQLTKDYPMGIHPEGLQVTGTGVTAKFGTKNATIPLAKQDTCFSGL
ncbi:LmeA family phospholipid-binding protein [Mycobacterium sp. HM-7]